MAFEKKVPEWNAAGTEPPESLKTSGFEPGMKPPAAYFNWFWNGMSEAVKELQGMTPEKIGGAAAAHATQHGASGSDPITPDMIGAAPTGYGLGGNIQRVTTAAELDAFTVSGWKSFYNVTTPLEAGGTKIYTGVVRCDSYSEYYCVQTICSVGSGYFLQRICSYGEWGEWEWINPFLYEGTEYRTTERWNGKPVYVKMIDLGASENNKVVTVLSSGCKMIRHIDLCSSYPLPHINQTLDNAYTYYLMPDQSGFALKMYCGSSVTGLQTYSAVYYYKE